MKYLLFLVIVLFSSLSFATPFIVCDPQAGVDHFVLTGPAWIPTTVTAQADGSIKLDIATALIGSNAITVKACKNDTIWGEQCSASVPFSFTRPSAPAITSNIRLTQ
jgi:hypothetical protein